MNADGDLGLCPHKGATFWTFSVISEVARPLLTFVKRLNISRQLFLVK